MHNEYVHRSILRVFSSHKRLVTRICLSRHLGSHAFLHCFLPWSFFLAVINSVQMGETESLAPVPVPRVRSPPESTAIGRQADHELETARAYCLRSPLTSVFSYAYIYLHDGK